MGFGMKPGGSDDKLWMESLPGGSEKPTIIHNNPTCSRVPSALWGPCGTGGGDRELPSALVCAGLCTGLDGGVSRTLGELQTPCGVPGVPCTLCCPAGLGTSSLPWAREHPSPLPAPGSGDTGGFPSLVCPLGQLRGQRSPLSSPDKTVKLWKVSERDKRPEGYNLKDEDGRLRDPSMITVLRVSVGALGAEELLPAGSGVRVAAGVPRVPWWLRCHPAVIR